MSAQQERPGYPAPVLAAAILAAEGVSFLLVGSAALWLHGEAISVADADVVIEPAGENLRCLGDALAELALRPGEVVSRMHRLNPDRGRLVPPRTTPRIRRTAPRRRGHRLVIEARVRL